MSLLHVFINLLAKDKGNKGMTKNGSKRKVENKKSMSGDRRQR